MRRIEQLFGIDVPILQAPIGSASCPELVAAVSGGGGLGMLAGTWRNPDDLVEDIRRIRALCSRPFAVNLGVHIDPREKIELCLREAVPVISLFWGDARAHFATIHAGGAKVMATIGTAREAKLAAEAGADAVIAQGWEAGGHVWGRTSTFALIREVRAAVPETPIVAAGGIGDGAGIAAAIRLGADGACLGTRFIVARESRAHPEYQRRVLGASAEETYYTELFDIGWPNAPHRVLKNSTITEWLAAGKRIENPSIAVDAAGNAIPRYSSRLPTIEMSGEIEAMALYAGQSVGHCRAIQPAAEIVRELARAAGL